MLRAKAARPMAKLRVTRGRPSRSSAAGLATASPKSAIAARAIASACSAAAVGFQLCASRTEVDTIAVAARNAASFLRSLQEATVEVAKALGIDARPRARTCDRLRWEWLASTAMILDGAPDERLATECARILSEVDVTFAAGIDGEIVARFRVALAEAHSLASSIAQMRRTVPAIAHG